MEYGFHNNVRYNNENHVARTPSFRTAFAYTCWRGQTSGLTVRPDAARWSNIYTREVVDHGSKLQIQVVDNFN